MEELHHFMQKYIHFFDNLVLQFKQFYSLKDFMDNL